jgi:hypothetical protein
MRAGLLNVNVTSHQYVTLDEVPPSVSLTRK